MPATEARDYKQEIIEAQNKLIQGLKHEIELRKEKDKLLGRAMLLLEQQYNRM